MWTYWMAQLFIYEIRKVWLVKCRLFDLYLRKETVDQLEGGGVKGGGEREGKGGQLFVTITVRG